MGGGGGGGGGGGLPRYFDGGVWLKLSHSIHIKAKSEKHIHNMTTIFYLYMIVFHSMTQPFLLHTLAAN